MTGAPGDASGSSAKLPLTHALGAIQTRIVSANAKAEQESARRNWPSDRRRRKKPT
jgi:hypothetical protein